MGMGMGPTFEAETKSAKIPIPHTVERGEMWDQFPTFDGETKSLQVPNSLYGSGGARGYVTTFQLLMLSPNLLNPKFPIWWGRGGAGQLPTFDAESKSAKILNCKILTRIFSTQSE